MEAFVLAIMVMVMGSIAVGILGGVLGDMVPSLPPGLAPKPHAMEGVAPAWQALQSGLHRHGFGILFGVIFAGKLLTRLFGHARDEGQGGAASGLRRISRRVWSEWFRVVVVNAFGAFVLAYLAQWTQAFSLTHWLWQLIFNAIGALVHILAGLLPWSGAPGLVESLASWFNDNQLKFTFWFLYSAAICDDLGLPNYKTLARWLWRRWRRRTVVATSTSNLPSVSPP